ncbi:MAG: hypothetical protein FWB78_08725, partial [Treponema sp.]|nr:hypothetical protein [Treponema sp.]
VTLTATTYAGYLFLNWTIYPEITGLNVNNTPLVFYMPPNDVTVNAVFEADVWDHGPLVIYRNGPRPGLRLVPLYENPFWHTTGTTMWEAGTPIENWGSGVDMRTLVTGPNGNTRAIRIPRLHPTDAYDGFGLALAEGETIDLTNVVALSFWARVSEGTTIGRTFGFGNPGEYAEPTGWFGSHRGPLFTGNNNDGVTGITDEWQRFIVPFPQGLTAPEEINRVFTFTGPNWAGRYLYIAEMEFLTEGVVFEGLRVPAELDPRVLGAEVDVSEIFSDSVIAWEHRLTVNNSIQRVFMGRTPGDLPGNQVPLWGWTMPANHNRFTIADVYVEDGDPNAVTYTTTTITSSGPAVVYLTLRSGQGFDTNAVRIEFAELEYIMLSHFDDIPVGATVGPHGAGHGLDTTYANITGLGYVDGQYAISYAFAGAGMGWWSQVSRVGQSWDISDFDYISFWIKDDPRPTNTAFEQHFRFQLFSGAPYYFIPASFFELDYEGQGWMEIRLPLSEFRRTGGVAAELLNTVNVTGWRLVMLPYPQNLWYHPSTQQTIYIANIRAIRGERGDGSFTISFAGPQNPIGEIAGPIVGVNAVGYLAVDPADIPSLTNIRWYRGGIQIGTGPSIPYATAHGGQTGQHLITVRADRGDRTYSRVVRFTVNPQ